MGYDPVLDPWLAALLCGVGAVNAPVYITYFRAFGVQIASVLLIALAAVAVRIDRFTMLEGFAGLTIFYGLIVFYTQSISGRILEGIRLQLANASLAAQLQAALQLVTHDAETDMLTDQPNRRALDVLLHQQISLAHNGNRPFAVLMLDIDHFKQINDSYGHGVGDEALRAFASRVRAHLRPGDVCTRYGGEEFVVVLPGTTLKAAFDVAERLRRGVADAPLLNSPVVNPTVSIGVAEYVAGQTAAQLLEAADAAVYAAKRGGRDQVRGPGRGAQ
jgi:diguanylate cyclase (GGDEF)-like protein